MTPESNFVMKTGCSGAGAPRRPALWRAREPENAILNFLCELGPREYAITGPDGYEQSDRWDEALMIKRLVREIWDRLDREDART